MLRYAFIAIPVVLAGAAVATASTPPHASPTQPRGLPTRGEERLMVSTIVSQIAAPFSEHRPHYRMACHPHGNAGVCDVTAHGDRIHVSFTVRVVWRDGDLYGYSSHLRVKR